MKSASECWLKVGQQLDIEVRAPFEVELDGGRVHFAALLPQFGAPRGMVVDDDSDKIWAHRRSLLAAGYGFSCVELNDCTNVDPPVEMLADWGWSSDSPTPDWLRP